MTAPAEHTFDKEKVLARIKKMMTLANDAAASEGERDNALRMAQATLTKYNLSMSDAERAHTGQGEARNKDSVDTYGYPWAKRMAQHIGLLFFCRYFFVTIRSDKCKHFFVGRESNTITAKEMTAYVIASIMSEANRRKRTEGRDWTWHTSFCKGAAERVIERCAALRRDAEAESAKDTTRSTSGTALVLASFYKQELEANDAWINANVGRLRSSKSREQGARADGHAAGREHGGRISLNRQVSSGSSNTKRIK